jgi:hypothetical protein
MSQVAIRTPLIAADETVQNAAVSAPAAVRCYCQAYRGKAGCDTANIAYTSAEASHANL